MEAQLVFSSEWVKNKNVLICSSEYDCLLANKIMAVVNKPDFANKKIRDYATQHNKIIVNKRIKQ